MSEVEFTVIICTYNRSSNLPECLSRLARQRGVDGLKWEVLVVDNNSSDDTQVVLREVSEALPIQIRVEFEGEQGLNYARNHGVLSSYGKYFCFIDDDILVSEDWLSAIYSTLEAHGADAVGGRIHLDKNLKLPRWINDEMRGFLGFQDLGEASFQMDGKSQYPFGGNMAFNRRIVDKIGLFNPKLGRKGEGKKKGELFKGAETDYFHRLAASGSPVIYYAPDAVVYHQVIPFQLTKKYFKHLHYNAGYQKAYHDGESYDKTISGVPRFLFRQYLDAITTYLGQLLTKGPDFAFRQKMTVLHFFGQIRGYYKQTVE